jgi:hypothetical protein
MNEKVAVDLDIFSPADVLPQAASDLCPELFSHKQYPVPVASSSLRYFSFKFILGVKETVSQNLMIFR